MKASRERLLRVESCESVSCDAEFIPVGAGREKRY